MPIFNELEHLGHANRRTSSLVPCITKLLMESTSFILSFSIHAPVTLGNTFNVGLLRTEDPLKSESAPTPLRCPEVQAYVSFLMNYGLDEVSATGKGRGANIHGGVQPPTDSSPQESGIQRRIKLGCRCQAGPIKGR